MGDGKSNQLFSIATRSTMSPSVSDVFIFKSHITAVITKDSAFL